MLCLNLVDTCTKQFQENFSFANDEACSARILVTDKQRDRQTDRQTHAATLVHASQVCPSVGCMMWCFCRDNFYSILREWETSHNTPHWNFQSALRDKIR